MCCRPFSSKAQISYRKLVSFNQVFCRCDGLYSFNTFLLRQFFTQLIDFGFSFINLPLQFSKSGHK